jgi:hypothetical protein
VKALTRLEGRFANAPKPKGRSRRSSRNLSEIASQLFCIESLLSSGYNPSADNDSYSDLGPRNSRDGKDFGFPDGTKSSLSPYIAQTQTNTVSEALTGYTNPRHVRVQSFAGFVGHSSLSSIQKFRCICCGKETKMFDSMSALK